MKRILTVVISLLISGACLAFSGTVSGHITNAPGSGVVVFITVYNGASTMPGAILLSDTTTTDSAGNYFYPYTVASTAGFGIVKAEITDCFSAIKSDTAIWDSLTIPFQLINLIYCPPAGCNAAFSWTSSGPTVIFTDNSTPTTAFGRRYSWNFGDGNTLSGSFPNPVHAYTLPGTYVVCLTITDSLPSCTSVFCDTIVTGTGGMVIAGMISTGGTAPGASRLYLIEENNASLTIADSLDLSTGNTYSFPVGPGTYHVKAGLSPANPEYNDYLPTYYTNSLSWSTATAIVITSSGSYNNDIELIAATGSSGPGSISGSVTMGEVKAPGPGDPVAGVSVILTHENDEGAAHTLTDSAGGFEFPSLAYGVYKVFVEIIGKTPHPRLVTLNATNPKEENIHFVVDEGDVSTGMENNIAVALKSIYPNPASDQVSIQLEAKNLLNATLALTDLVGHEVVVRSVVLNPGNQVLTLDVSELPAGIYLLRLENGGMIKTEKLVKY